MRIFARAAYGSILRMHPRDFIAEFGDEMLWIFEEQMLCDKRGFARIVLCAQLFLDALRSAFVQRALREQQQPELCGPQFGLLGSSAFANQVVQGGLILFSSVFSVMSIALCLRMVISNL